MKINWSRCFLFINATEQSSQPLYNVKCTLVQITPHQVLTANALLNASAQIVGRFAHFAVIILCQSYCIFSAM